MQSSGENLTGTTISDGGRSENLGWRVIMRRTAPALPPTFTDLPPRPPASTIPDYQCTAVRRQLTKETRQFAYVHCVADVYADLFI